MIQDVAQAAQTIGNFLHTFTAGSGLRLRYRIKLRSSRPQDADHGSDSAGSEDNGPRTLVVEFDGPDTPLLTARNGELLNALEHVAAKILRLEPDSHDRVLFDADHFKVNRERQLRDSATAAVRRVQDTGEPHAFPPMSSRERRMLHLMLRESGLATASSGEGPNRFVVLYPAGTDVDSAQYSSPTPRRRDASHIRSAFRHR